MPDFKPEGRMLYKSDEPVLRVPNGDVLGDLFVRCEDARQINELGDAIFIKPHPIKYHAHKTGAETFLMLRGSIMMYINKRKCKVAPGDLMHIRENVHHGFEILEENSAWRELFQEMDMYGGIARKANLRDFTPELLEDEEFNNRRLARLGTDYRDIPAMEEVDKHEIPEIKPADKPYLTFENDLGKFHLRVPRWETDGVKEIWQFDLKKGAVLEFDMPFGDSPFYSVLAGSLHVDSDRENFDAEADDMVKIPHYLRHKLTATEDVSLLAMNVQSNLLNIMEQFKADQVHNPEALKDWAYVQRVLVDNNCWLTGYKTK